MPKPLLILVLSLLATTLSWAQTAADSIYVWEEDLPNADIYLPAPPDTASVPFVDDMIQWQWGKTQRNTPRGRQASDESLWLADIMRTIVAQVLELDTISDTTTPALARLLVRSYYTGDRSTAAAKRTYMRTRPFVEMNEDTWGRYDDDFLRTNGSYPSGHSAFGFAVTLAFSEMWPEKQDTLMRRGFQFGENRIITGAHYQSDVNAGYLCGAAAIARAHVNPDFEKDIQAARAEYITLKGLPTDYDPTVDTPLPRGEKILNLPVDTTSYRYLADIMRYWDAKRYYGTEQAEQACQYGNNSIDYLLLLYGNAMDMTLSADDTPAIAQLMSVVIDRAKEAARALKATNFRKRPYVQLGTHTLTPQYDDEERTESSFASGHATLGWALALILAEVAPDHQDALLRLGYDYGQARLIVGFHWATDIEAARIFASAVIARLHADSTILDQIRQARQEYLSANSIDEIRHVTSPTPAFTPTYDLQGRRVAHPAKGIYIIGGRKVWFP